MNLRRLYSEGADRFFRLVLGYCAGTQDWQSSDDNRRLRGHLQEAVLPHALKVFGAVRRRCRLNTSG